MARKRANLSDLLNDLTFKILFNKAKLLAVSAHEWSGLPEGIEGKYVENYLFDHGKAIFFVDPDKSYMALEAHNSGKFNVYGEPLAYVATGFGYNKTIAAEDCVIIENNSLRRNTYDFVMHYVNKLTEAERTMDVNVKRCKTPFVFGCDDKDALTIKSLFAQIDGNVPAIFADKRLNLDGIQLFKTEAKFLGNELMDYKKSVENELYTFLGYNNTPVDKKERTNVPEVTSNNQLIESFADMQLAARERACEAINKKYGLNVSVKRRKEVSCNVEEQSVQHNEIDS